jgi:hypothetical protein
MAETAQLSPELARGVTAIARALISAARSWTMYPPDHPVVSGAVGRLKLAVTDVATGGIFSMGVTPDTLLIEGISLASPDKLVGEAAALLHDKDILQLSFFGEVAESALRDLLKLLSQDAASMRGRGGPAAIWGAEGDQSIVVEQIDYLKVLEDRDLPSQTTAPDDLWRAIVQSMVDGRKIFDEGAELRLLEIATDSAQIRLLANDVMEPKRGPDGSPMITTQAATVLAAFRHLVSIVSLKAADRLPEIMRNLAAAAAELDPHVVLQLLRTDDDPADGVAVVRGMSAAFDDEKVAQLLATALAADGQASGRLAQVFDTIAPDAERKRRVLGLTRSLLHKTNFGKASQFHALWSSMEELLISYNERPFVSAGYGSSLDAASSRADAMAARDLPPEIDDWMNTLGQENIRKLSVSLLIDLFRLETDAARAADVAGDLASLCADLLLSGDYADALRVAGSLSRAAREQNALGREAARVGLESVASSPGLFEAVTVLGELEPVHLEPLGGVFSAVGAAAVDVLRSPLVTEADTVARQRASDIVAGYGAAAVRRLAPMLNDERWFAQRNGAQLMGRIGHSEAVPYLQALLRRGDARVARAAVAALARIDDPAAGRAIHTVLRAASGEMRQAVISALVDGGDPQVLPVLSRILEESKPFGSDHPIVLAALEAAGAFEEVASARTVQAIAAVMAQRSVLARKKARAVKHAAVRTLARIGSEPARRALDHAGEHGDRMLRKIVRDWKSGQEKT